MELRNLRIAVPAVLATIGTSALAAVDVTDVEAAGADALLYAAAVAGVLISIWAAKLAYRKFFGG